MASAIRVAPSAPRWLPRRLSTSTLHPSLLSISAQWCAASDKGATAGFACYSAANLGSFELTTMNGAYAFCSKGLSNFAFAYGITACLAGTFLSAAGCVDCGADDRWSGNQATFCPICPSSTSFALPIPQSAIVTENFYHFGLGKPNHVLEITEILQNFNESGAWNRNVANCCGARWRDPAKGEGELVVFRNAFLTPRTRRMAAAEMTPSGAAPMPIRQWVPVPAKPQAMAA